MKMKQVTTILLAVCFMICLISAYADSADDPTGETLCFPSILGVYVIGEPDEEYEVNGLVYGNIRDENGSNMLLKNYYLCDLSDCEGYENIIIVACKSNEWYKFGFYDRESRFLCEPCYDEILYYTYNSEKLVGVCKNEKWGFCERNSGAIIIPLIYDAVFSEFNHGYAIVIKAYNSETIDDYSEKYVLVNQSGEEISLPNNAFPIASPDALGRLVIFDTKTELYGIYDINENKMVTRWSKSEPNL